MKKKLEVITKINRKQCYICKGEDKSCRACEGTGVYKDKTYFFIVNGYAYSGDTLK